MCANSNTLFNIGLIDIDISFSSVSINPVSVDPLADSLPVTPMLSRPPSCSHSSRWLQRAAVSS